MRRNIVVLRTSVKLAGAAAAAAMMLCACGPVKMGAAAIVGSQRISAATLTAQSANLSAAYQTDIKKKVQISYKPAQIPQQTLSWLLRFRVRDALARQEGISVTPEQQQQALTGLTAQVKQSGFASLQEAGVASGIPPDLIGDLARYQAIGTQLVTRLDGGKAPTSAAAQNVLNAQLNKAQCLASKSLNIEVNPQFGVFDYGLLAVIPAQAKLSAPQAAASPSPSPAPSASPTPQLTPPC